jgi:hypothetical protein
MAVKIFGPGSPLNGYEQTRFLQTERTSPASTSQNPTAISAQAQQRVVTSDAAVVSFSNAAKLSSRSSITNSAEAKSVAKDVAERIRDDGEGGLGAHSAKGLADVKDRTSAKQ